MKKLPDFRSHGFDEKFTPLKEFGGSLPIHTERFVQMLIDVEPQFLKMTVLDFGCGRGDLVVALRKRGVRAFGVEVNHKLIKSASKVNEEWRDEFPLLSILDHEGKSLFKENFFDMIISDQVLEHVQNLESVALEISRVMKFGGLTVHQFPARFIILEPHLHIPFVHWLPKSQIRLLYIQLMLILGYCSDYFSKYKLSERGLILYRYSVEETFYRSPKEIELAFAKYGISTERDLYLSTILKRYFGFSFPVLNKTISTFRLGLFGGRKSR